MNKLSIAKTSGVSSTESLRRDHYLIEKMLRALTVTAELLHSGKSIPSAILDQSMEFTENFVLVCHHGKEEETLFPALEKNGMAREGGPIARMIFEHGIAKKLAAKMHESARNYQQTNDPSNLVLDIKNYVDHVSSHLTKENFRLFVMADMVLKGKSAAVDSDLAATEQAKLTGLGKDRHYYERLVGDFEAGTASVH